MNLACHARDQHWHCCAAAAGLLEALSLRLTSTRSSCFVADSDSMPGSAAAIFLNRACGVRRGMVG